MRKKLVRTVRRTRWPLLLVALTLAGGAVGPERAALAQGSPVLALPAPTDLAFVADPAIRSSLAILGNKSARRIGADGSFRANVRNDTVVIQRQRRAWDVVAAGVAGRKPTLVNTGLAAIAWGLAQARPDGSFPLAPWKSEEAILPQSFFLATAGRSLRLVAAAGLDPATTRRAAALEPALLRSAHWLLAAPELYATVRTTKNTNGIFVAAAAVQMGALIGDDAALAARARELVAAGLGRQTADGVFPEGGGFDSNYQLVSLDYLAQYAASLPPGPWRTEVLASLGRGTDRLVAATDPRSGRTDDAGNTRTVSCGIDKEKATERRMRLRYLAALLGRPDLADLADRVGAAQQNFNHIEDCDNPDP